VEEAGRRGELAIHRLAPEESRVETVFIRRRDAFVSSALASFIEFARKFKSRKKGAVA
jgi:LysR family transcriptional regulator, cell division regulator